jgi:predicted nucleic acid-binding protein
LTPTFWSHRSSAEIPGRSSISGRPATSLYCLSRDIIDEYLDVLQRLEADPALISELLSLFAGGYHLLFAGSTPFLKIVRDDPDDDKFFECAVALKASVIVTGDKAMLKVGNYMGIAVMNPQQFLASRPGTTGHR